MRHATLMISTMVALLASDLTHAGQLEMPSPRRPFVATLSNNTPLAFGMDIEAATRALGQPLNYVGGRPGNETYLALRDIGGSELVPHHHRLFLQFRQGRLTGWKEDYGENWMWD